MIQRPPSSTTTVQFFPYPPIFQSRVYPDDPYLYALTAQLVKLTPPQGACADRKGLPPLTDREVQAYAAATVVRSPSDTVQSYFGMRKISTGINPATGKMALLLHNKPLFQNVTLEQG